MIKLVAFDLDGTIGDTIPLCIKAFKIAAEPHTGHEISEEDIIQTFGLDEEGMMKQIVGNNNWEVALIDFYAIYKRMHISCPQPFEGITELINVLKDNSIFIVLITGKGKKSCEMTLRQFDIEKCFDRIETGSSVKNRKSEAINSILESYNLTPDEMLYIGDSVSDIVECDKASVKCLSAAWGATPTAIQQLKEKNQGNVFCSVSSLQVFLMRNIYSTQKI